MPRRNRTQKHQPFIDTSTCSAKRRFTSEKLALDEVEIQELQHMGQDYSAYKCDRCGGWHLTRKKTT